MENDVRVAILVTNGFEHSELFEPKKILETKGFKTEVVSIESGRIKSWKDGNWGESIDVDLTLEKADHKNFAALLVPGGVINPDILRGNEKAVDFVGAFHKSGKPIAAICHGPWLLVEADVLHGMKATSYGSIKKDLVNAGARWVDQSVVNDSNIITSRSPKDINDFSLELISAIQASRNKKNKSETIMDQARA